jgi:phosphomannomutase
MRLTPEQAASTPFYPCSGAINDSVSDAQATMERVREYDPALQAKVDTTDGLSLEFAIWRWNLRPSNTEPLLRLNVESRADHLACSYRVSEIEDQSGNMLVKEH